VTTVALIQARMGSSRLPGKVLEDLAGRAVLDWVVSAARAIPGVDRVAVATSDRAGDDAIVAWCASQSVVCHRGPEADVLERMRGAAEAEGAQTVLRLTADCPFLDPAVCGQVLLLFERSGADYASNVDPPRWPDGLDCEVLTCAALVAAAREATRASDREHVTPFVRDQRHRFRIAALGCPIPGLACERWALDTADDLDRLRQIAERLGPPPVGHVAVLRAAAQIEMPILATRNEGFEATLVAEDFASRGFAASQALLARAKQIIPLGAQTFSKSFAQFPRNGAPHFLSHGEGGRVWDVDGNRYVDLIGGLLPIVLGYRDPDVDAAIVAQLANGISFSLATELEAALAERLVEIIPCAEMVRFGKNGSDATTAAVRLARAHTGRDRIAVSGYHGWQDWYIGTTTRSAGVPATVQDLTDSFPAHDLAALEALFAKHSGEYAAVVMEPMTLVEPDRAGLEALAEFVRDQGALLVFDEVVTGFRFALGGAQDLFGVTPDLACFGKAMANGMPLSALVGRADIMRGLEDVFISATFGGETLSLAAAIAVIDKMRREPVIETLWKTGTTLAEGTQSRIDLHGLGEVLALAGKPPWMLWQIAEHTNGSKAEIRTLLMKELIARGVLTLGSHNVCYAHNEADIQKVLSAYDAALRCLADALGRGRMVEALNGPAIEPVFRVRA